MFMDMHARPGNGAIPVSHRLTATSAPAAAETSTGAARYADG